VERAGEDDGHHQRAQIDRLKSDRLGAPPRHGHLPRDLPPGVARQPIRSPCCIVIEFVYATAKVRSQRNFNSFLLPQDLGFAARACWNNVDWLCIKRGCNELFRFRCGHWPPGRDSI
jgi:hypothetical protein